MICIQICGNVCRDIFSPLLIVQADHVVGFTILQVDLWCFHNDMSCDEVNSSHVIRIPAKVGTSATDTLRTVLDSPVGKTHAKGSRHTSNGQ